MKRPAAGIGMRHVALCVKEFAACEHFYVDLMGMREEWRPDSDNLYLCSGSDNLALHRAPADAVWDEASQRLDHIGFFFATVDEVDRWYDYLLSQGVRMRNAPRTHRDGARSFYCYDPDGTCVQIIYHPPVANAQRSGAPRAAV